MKKPHVHQQWTVVDSDHTDQEILTNNAQQISLAHLIVHKVEYYSERAINLILDTHNCYKIIITYIYTHNF